MTNFSRTGQAPTLVVFALDGPAPAVRTGQATALIPQTGFAPLNISQAPTLVVYGDGPPDDFTLRAWGFMLDGHPMYALSLGNLGTFVVDLSTGQWSNWETTGYSPMWNAQNGLMWQDMIVGGDMSTGVLWLVDPDAELDEGFRPVTHAATAILPARARDGVVVGALTANAAVGYPSFTGATINLRFSDDGGKSWAYMQPLTMIAGDDEEEPQLLAWRSLGSFGQPGRVFEIYDVGATIRLSDIDVVLDGEQNDG